MKTRYRAAVAVLTVGVSMAHSGDFSIDRSSIDGGGVMRSRTESPGSLFELSGTIGQPDATVMSGTSFSLTGGLWLRIVPGDCNETGAVEVYDYAQFAGCVTGPIEDPFNTPTPAICQCLDFNQDGRIDLVDFGGFQSAINGHH